MRLEGMARGYQPRFFIRNPRVRDPDVRKRKADKIRWVLENVCASALDRTRCLDIGCSSGLITAQLATLFQSTIGIDYDDVALGSIEDMDRQCVAFLRGDAMCLPLPDAVADVIICAQTYEHVPNDSILFREMYRVLAPGGLVFFSGPNWLFPIEPHYFLPFLHWLPKTIADRYLQLTGLDQHYYERLRSFWALQHLARPFEIQSVTPHLLTGFFAPAHPLIRSVVRSIPSWIWPLLEPLVPNFNWILRKPTS